ncbi:NAD(P)-dependent oxidoreductase [Opitutales bacterium]|jgi:UDP-glucose 4-epimerase|nr:NAD(P)-dependent oxidoreductase [Opitutales bacterium]
MILVTGANGLLGRDLLERFQGVEVHAIVRSMPKDPVPKVKYHVLDLNEQWSVEQLPTGVKVIIHLAQSAYFRDFPDSALRIFKVNVDSTARLLDYAKMIGVEQFIYASSGGVYGSGKKAFDENSQITSSGNLGYYLGSKLASEILAQSYSSLMKVEVLRFFFMYGRRQNRSMLIPRLVERVKLRELVSLEGDNGIRINPIHVSDASKAVVAVLEIQSSLLINIAGSETLSIRDICLEIGTKVGEEPLFQSKGGEPSDLIANISLMKNKLHDPEVKINTGILDFL